MAETDPKQEPVQVSLLTGFLGSGKTTLLNKLVKHPEMVETAVLINEFGEIGLDHQLVERIDENTVLLNAGCLCCTVQGDLVNALSDLFFKRSRGEVPYFRRVLIETTGLADPAPIIHTLMTAPQVCQRFALDGIITTIDAVNAENELDSHEESVKQAAVADRLVITKSDLVTSDDLKGLKDRLSALNTGAPQEVAIMGEIAPYKVLDTGLYDPKTKSVDVQRWLRDEAYLKENGSDHQHPDHGHNHHHNDVNRHDDLISAFCMTRDDPIDWEAFVAWIRILIGQHGENLLRIKGILNISGRDKPIAIHGVQHMFHDPAELAEWPDEDRRSRIVFITRGLDQNVLEEKLDSLTEQAAKLDN
ncbi:MAG: putative GTP-binding protein YjiA [Alphaproteobacteria bacterium MarineAlpha11_Bin1]|nr:MAG: putative GTP-binding protein YjiA [Alphaproteobacteria bacterium MarineAlpha11_Bin1]|tara:strand:+ start:1063 stop:2145 length:1083 start_codon:yes stop_codon:yes gene_type:complete